jgi:predicted metal-binding protein
MKPWEQEPRRVLAELAEMARARGASAAAEVDPAAVRVEDALAGMCRSGCPNYGRAPTCPPHVGGPEEMRGLLARAERALAFKMDLPAERLRSGDPEMMRPVHRVAAAVERAALAAGAGEAAGFAGGSCRRVFCAAEPACPVLEGSGACLHPGRARPSLSGYGVNVQGLMEAAGWSLWDARRQEGALAGMVLVGRRPSLG